MKVKITIIGAALVMLSCKTYTIAPESFKSQMIKANILDTPIDSLDNTTSTLYSADFVSYLNVKDDKGAVSFVPNNGSIEMRAILKNGEKRMFYLDQLQLRNDTLIGLKSKILGLRNAIPFNEIALLEVQDSKKYVFEESVFDKVDRIKLQHEIIYKNSGKEKERFDVTLDSISAEVSAYQNVYFARCMFEKSGSEVSLFYTIKNNDVIKIAIREKSSKDNDNLWMTVLYCEKKKIIYTEEYFANKTEIVNSKKERERLYQEFEFNKNISLDFLKTFVIELYTAIKAAR